MEDNNQKKIFNTIVADPNADIGSLENLEQLVDAYPYVQSLRYALARKKTLRDRSDTAAVLPAILSAGNSAKVYSYIYSNTKATSSPEGDDARFFSSGIQEPNHSIPDTDTLQGAAEKSQHEPDLANPANPAIAEAPPAYEEAIQHFNHIETVVPEREIETPPEAVIADKEIEAINPAQEIQGDTVAEQEGFSDSDAIAPKDATPLDVIETIVPNSHQQERYFSDEELGDETSEFPEEPAGSEAVALETHQSLHLEEGEPTEPMVDTVANEETPNDDTPPARDNASPAPTDELALDHPAATDFLAYAEHGAADEQQTIEENIDQETSNDNQQTPAASSSDRSPNNEIVPLAQATPHEKVSKYDDEHMPYSFLWWLHKTRLEHADTYQPYAATISAQNRQPLPPVLDQQIRENIFHLQAPEDKLSEHSTIPFQVPKKTDPIIERFIREEPQIKPLQPDKINLENKAKKSAEDQLSLVSETLADIYTNQGLYTKAIDVYHKLSLKYPEKSSYFADRIAELEKKLN